MTEKKTVTKEKKSETTDESPVISTEEVKIEPAAEETPTAPVESGIDEYNAEVAVAKELVADSQESTATEFAEGKENDKILDEDEKFREKLQKGEINTSGLSATQLSEIQKPLVAAPLGGKPVYETASAYMAAEAAKGNLTTPPVE